MHTIPPPIQPGRQSALPDQHKEDALQKILQSQQLIKAAKERKITFSDPVLWQKDNPVIFPKTINVIQGKAGVHKSRLAETVCAALLSKPHNHTDLLDFRIAKFKQYAVVYVDTERNLSEQLPYALQQIQMKAGYDLKDHPANFDYISLLEFGREERFEMLNVYLEYIRQRYDEHVFIVLDVITDCIFNFNDTKDSMKLIDMLNQSINNYNVTFLCLIHENPGSADKARGHLGTEILNKASTVLQIGFEKDADNSPMDLLKVTFLKCRSTKKLQPFYVQYSDTTKGLVISDPETVREALNKKNHKGDVAVTLELLALNLEQPKPRRELIDILMAELNCKERLIENRLKQIVSTPIQITNYEGSKFWLSKKPEGKEIIYYLVPA